MVLLLVLTPLQPLKPRYTDLQALSQHLPHS
jgi:hypothetical protein